MTILFILAFLVGLLMLYAYSRPSSFLVHRKITIAAPAKTIMPYLRNLQEGVKWSEWEKIDPTGSRTYSGPKGAVGSVYQWDSQNRQAGAGRQEIIALSDTRVEVDLQFFRPMAGRAKVDYILEPVGNATVVTIDFTSTASFVQKMMCLFFSPQKMIGSMHEKSLMNLRALVEGESSVKSRIEKSVATAKTPASKAKKATAPAKKNSAAKPKAKK